MTKPSGNAAITPTERANRTAALYAPFHAALHGLIAERLALGLAPAIITNPPYNLINWRDGRGGWVTHAMETLGVEYMALLLSWSWPGAGGLSAVWSSNPPARVYLMRWKIDFTGAGAPPMLNGWFVWDRKHKGETILRMLDRDDDHRQESLL